MDPAWEKIFRQRQGAVEVEDFDDEVRIRKSKKKAPKPRQRGCPGNDHGAHVYVWTTELEPTGYLVISWNQKKYPSFYKKHGFHRQEAYACVGCGTVKKRRYTEQMQKRIAKVGWYRANNDL